MNAQPVLPAYSMNVASFPRMYERSLVEPLFRPWAEALLDLADLQPGASVIDVACGTGIVARLAQQRLQGAGRVVGVDVSAPMLEVAREMEPSVDWRVGDAAALPVGPGERFDRVLCQQGLQFFAARQASAQELRRVLAPGGRLVAAVWRGAETMPVFDVLQRTAERHLGPIRDQRYAFGDRTALSALLATAGFGDVQIEARSLVCRFPDGADFVRMNTMALVGMSGTEVGDELLDTIARESMEAMRPFMEGAAIRCEMHSNLAVAS